MSLMRPPHTTRQIHGAGPSDDFNVLGLFQNPSCGKTISHIECNDVRFLFCQLCGLKSNTKNELTKHISYLKMYYH